MRSVVASLTLLAALLPGLVRAAEPCTSGLAPGQKPGPYSSIVSVGAERGQPHCFICDTAERPAVIIFARSFSDPLGKLVAGLDKAVGDSKQAADKAVAAASIAGLDKAVGDGKSADLRSWVTFLSDDQTALDPQVVEWGKKYAVRDVPLGVFENIDGPPSYRLSREAAVTVLLFVNRKVAANFAFRQGELTEERVAEVLKALPGILPVEKK